MKNIPHRNRASLSAICVAMLGDRSETLDWNGLLNQKDGYEFVVKFSNDKSCIEEIRTLFESEGFNGSILLIKPIPSETLHFDLTPHELRVLTFLVEGLSYKAIGQALDVSINTVSFHVRRIYEKLEVHTKAEAIAKAIRNSLV
jgi:DNA-binding NarL/FixJ family response regulator